MKPASEEGISHLDGGFPQSLVLKCRVRKVQPWARKGGYAQFMKTFP